MGAGRGAGKCGQSLTQLSSGSIRKRSYIYHGAWWMKEALSTGKQVTQRKEPPLPPEEVKAGFLEEVTRELSLKG